MKHFWRKCLIRVRIFIDERRELSHKLSEKLFWFKCPPNLPTPVWVLRLVHVTILFSFLKVILFSCSSVGFNVEGIQNKAACLATVLFATPLWESAVAVWDCGLFLWPLCLSAYSRTEGRQAHPGGRLLDFGGRQGACDRWDIHPHALRQAEPEGHSPRGLCRVCGPSSHCSGVCPAQAVIRV